MISVAFFEDPAPYGSIIVHVTVPPMTVVDKFNDFVNGVHLHQIIFFSQFPMEKVHCNVAATSYREIDAVLWQVAVADGKAERVLEELKHLESLERRGRAQEPKFLLDSEKKKRLMETLGAAGLAQVSDIQNAESLAEAAQTTVDLGMSTNASSHQ